MQACSDVCAGFDLLQDGSLIESVSVTIGKQAMALSEFEQKIAIDAEIALSNSLWAVKDSRRLLAALRGS